ncbi:MAG: efflux system, outer rane lipoprotein NodT family [Chitinophagaceae bacterium]|nr:efflux system, outer rane lipoprotein NodT family [Chitinophagaceae bacterium]
MNRLSLFYRTIVFILICALLWACSVGKNYKRPELNTPSSYSAKPTADSSTAKKSWKEFFTDTTLQRLIDHTLAYNFNLQLAIKRMEVSQSYAKQSRLAWLPALNAQVSTATNTPSQNSLNGISFKNFLGTNHLEDYSIGLTLSWEIDIWGKIRRQKEAALATYLQSYEASRAVQTSLVAQVANSYYNLLMMDAQLQVAKKNVLLSDSVVQVMQWQKDAGDVTALAVQQAMTQQQNAAILVPQLEQAIILQENALRLLSGDWPGTVTRSAVLEPLITDDTLSVGVPADLLSLRPDVRANERALMAANARVGVAQANMYPSLNLTAAGGLNAFKASNWFIVPASLFGTAAGGLLQPVFQRRMLKTQREVAVLEREQRVIEFRQSVLGAAHEVTNALVKLDKLKIQQQIAGERMQVSEQAVANAQLLFRSGLANYLEVITAQGRALQAELDQAAITRQQLSARVELYQSLGGGWR